MAYQYPCIAGVQRPSLSEPGIVTALKCLPLKIKSRMSQKRSYRSGGIHEKGKVVRNVLIQPKLPSYSVGRIMDKPNTLIGQIGRPSSIGGRQISDSYLIKTC